MYGGGGILLFCGSCLIPSPPHFDYQKYTVVEKISQTTRTRWKSLDDVELKMPLGRFPGDAKWISAWHVEYFCAD